MDLNDSFSERLLQRVKAHREFVSTSKVESPLIRSKKRSALVDENRLENQDLITSEDSPKRQCFSVPSKVDCEKENEHIDEDECADEGFVPFGSSAGARGLAALRKKDGSSTDDDTSSQCSSEPEKNDHKVYIFSTQSEELCTSRKGRLANLAAHINQWEDDEHNRRPLTNTKNIPAKVSSVKITAPLTVKPLTSNVIQAANTFGVSVSQDKEASDFQMRSPLKIEPAATKISDKVAAWNKAANASLQPNEKRTVPLPQKLAIKVQQPKAVNFQSSNLDRSLDPAELPLSARKALFEKAINEGNSKYVEPSKLSVAQRAALFENAAKETEKQRSEPANAPRPFIASQSNAPSSPFKNGSPLKKKSSSDTDPNESPSKLMPPPGGPFSPVKPVGNHTHLVQQQLASSSNWQEKEHVAKAVTERKTEITNLVNRWEKLSSSSSIGISEEEQSGDTSNYDQSNYEEESELYYESGSESSDRYSRLESDLNMEGSASLQEPGADYDDYKEISMEEESEEYRDESVFENPVSEGELCKEVIKNGSVDKASKSSYSSSNFSACYSHTSSSTSSYDNPTEVAHGSNAQSGPETTPLHHTVSFYRKQKSENRTPPMQTIVRKEEVAQSTENEAQNIKIHEQIKFLQEEIVKQQTIIGQASRALNLCHATVEFSGSSEQIEGERLLLIATQKRQACMNEVQRLKSHMAAEQDMPVGIGTLTITDIRLPLKLDFISAKMQGKTSDSVHCFLCLIRHGAQVIVSQMVSTDDNVADGDLVFTNYIKLQNLPHDFSVVFEVYGMKTKKENLPHDKKYHIKKDNKIRLTPKGRKADGKILLPAVSSPGGPNAVRSSNFSVIGYTRFSINNCHKKCFTMDKVPFESPLESILKVKLNLHADYDIKERGFLTMFEDVSGFGAWHRRWCYLNKHYLSFWKYPDDEQKKDVIDTINLKQCTTGEVKLVSSDVCARRHTFQLMIVRPQEKGDKDTLISKKVNTLTTTRHLFSADTKEERIQWCNQLNEALTNIRKWDPQAMRPIEHKLG